MREKVEFTVWGQTKNLTLPAYAMRDEHESRIEAVCRSISTRTRLVVLACKHDCQTSRGEHHYQITLGERLSSGGYLPRAQIFVAI